MFEANKKRLKLEHGAIAYLIVDDGEVILVDDSDSGRQCFRWYMVGDAELFDTEVSARTMGDAIESARLAWPEQANDIEVIK